MEHHSGDRWGSWSGYGASRRRTDSDEISVDRYPRVRSALITSQAPNGMLCG